MRANSAQVALEPPSRSTLGKRATSRSNPKCRQDVTSPTAKINIAKTLEAGAYILCCGVVDLDAKVQKGETLTKEEHERLIANLVALTKVGPAVRAAMDEQLGLDGLEGLSDAQLEALEKAEIAKGPTPKIDDDDGEE